MTDVKRWVPFILSGCVVLLGPAARPIAQELPRGITAADLANNNKLFIELATKALHWDEPADPIKIVGPLYFVGTRGLGSYLFVTTEGNILLNTGTQKSGPMIVDSIRKLGFKPEDIKIIVNGHGHSDHAGAFAFMKEQTHAQVAIMQPDVAMVEDGGKSDFHYGNDWQVMGQPPVKVDRILRSGDTVKLGDVMLTGYNTPGHTRGATTWVTTLVDGGKTYTVVFPDGAGFNPGYQIAKPEEYPGINQDYRDTLHFLETLRPDIWLAHHTEYFDLEGKRARANAEGVRAWVDPEGYRRWVASKRRAFEDEVDREMGVKKSPVSEPASEIAAAPAPTSLGGTVTLGNFIRAETDRYFAQTAREGAFGSLRHSRTMTPIDAQTVVRMNRDTLYSSGVFDVDAAPLTVTLPDAGRRFMSMQVISQDHYTIDVVYGAGRFTYDKKKVGTRYVYVIVRTLVNPEDPHDVDAANALQDRIVVHQERKGTFQVPEWDAASLDRVRDSLSDLAELGMPRAKFGKKGEVDPVAHLIATAIGWGGNPESAAMYVSAYPKTNDGKTAYILTLKDVPVDGFWSISVYNDKGFFEKNALNAYSLNSLTAKPNPDGSFTVRFGECEAAPANCLPIVAGWNYTVRLYRPRAALLNGTWKLPDAQPITAQASSVRSD